MSKQGSRSFQKPHPLLYLHNRHHIAGAEKSLLVLIRQLDRSAFVPFFVLPSESEFAEAVRKEGAEVFFCPFPPFKSFRWDLVSRSLRLLHQIVSRLAPHLLHGNSPRTNFYAGWIGKQRRIPVVWHARNLIYGKMLDVEKIFSFVPERIICNSEAIRSRFRGVNGFEKKVTTVYSGVDLSEFRPDLDGKPFRLEFHLNEAPVVALVARLGMGKGHETFLQAAKKVSRKIPKVYFLIVGQAEDGEDQQREAFLRKLVAELHLDSQVIFTGYRKDMPSVMAAIDLLVVATEAEPFGRVILEAMAAGKPVVGTGTGGTPELIEAERTGLLVPPDHPQAMADAILRLLKNPEVSHQMGQSGIRRVQTEFNSEAHVQKIEALYHSLLG